MAKTHYGLVPGMRVCGASTIEIGATTNDLQAVDCVSCLWHLLSESIAASDRVAMRIKVVTAENGTYGKRGLK